MEDSRERAVKNKMRKQKGIWEIGGCEWDKKIKLPKRAGESRRDNVKEQDCAKEHVHKTKKGRGGAESTWEKEQESE